MGSRDHLIPSVTVDRNGHTKTVYVSPSGGGSRSSSLHSAVPTLARFEECESEEETDEDNGFGPDWEGVNDPESWQANEFDADDAQDWAYAGFDADDAYSWRGAGFGFSDAQEWSSAIQDTDEAKEWESAGFNADEARMWNQHGFTVDSAKEWQKEDFDYPNDAAEWSNQGFDPSDANEWKSAGFEDSSTASEWKSGIRGNRGVDLSDLLILHKRNMDADDSPSWLSLLETVKRLEGGENAGLESLLDVMDGVNPSAGHEYVKNYPYSQWSILASGGIEFDKVYAVQRAYSKIDENQQNEYEDDYEEDEVGTLEEAVSWIGPAEGFSHRKANAILALISENKCRPADVKLFLTNRSRLDYDDNNYTDYIIKADRWAREVAPKGSNMTTKTELFEKFYVALKGISGMDEIVEKHGPEKVEAAIHQGMLSEPQLRNFLDNVQVAGISEGAL
jgi:hypothetical protein